MPSPRGVNSPEEQLEFAKRGQEAATDREDARYWQGYRTALEWMMREHPQKVEREICLACRGRGQWDVECCNGSSGCACNGGLVFMGDCIACKGDGKVMPGNQRPTANANYIMQNHISYPGGGAR